MTDPSNNISAVLKRVRFERGLTLEETSGVTGVSKAMLGQIERGVSNPTISILWKISTGLKISFSELLGNESSSHEIVSIDEMEPIYESDGKMELYDVFPYDPLTGFEYFYIKLSPGAVHASTPHQESSEEYIVVTEGKLELKIEEEVFILEAPKAMKFKSNRYHTYSNPFEKDVVFQNIVRY